MLSEVLPLLSFPDQISSPWVTSKDSCPGWKFEIVSEAGVERWGAALLRRHRTFGGIGTIIFSGGCRKMPLESRGMLNPMFLATP